MRVRYEQRRRLIWVGVAALLALHVWAPHRDGVVAGVLPWDLAFHLAWMAAAALLVELFTRFAWRNVDGGADE